MAFVVGQHVWFKVAGSTPYVRGSASDPALPVSGGPDDPNSLDFGGSSLGGRGKPDISRSVKAQSGLADAQGVPTIDFSAFPTVQDVTSTVDDGDVTFPAAGQHLGVRDQVTDNNPLAPGHVSTDGVFDGPTPKRLSGLGTEENGDDDGDVTAAHDTIRDINPNQIGGRTTTALAGGASTPTGNQNEFASHTIDQTGANRVGVRTPSSEEAPGVVIEIVVVKNPGKSTDGTTVRAGSKLYWVNWGSSAVSNPHRSKSNNRMRTTVHAEADLVAA